MKNPGSILGWAGIAAALAIPAFIFYGWWTKTSAAKTDISAPITRAESRMLFKSRNDGFHSSTQTVPAPASQVFATLAHDPAPAAEPVRIPGPVTVSPAPAVPAKDASVPKEVVISSVSAVPVSSSASGARNYADAGRTLARVSFGPLRTRDPFMSSDDMLALQREKEAEKARERALLERKHVKQVKRPEKNPCDFLQLQGIIESATKKNVAIINGEIVSAGASIHGAKINKVSTDFIICEYRGKKVTKKL